jgi:hypothetical protein
MIRPLRPTDVVALAGLHERAALYEVTTHSWPKVPPESGHLSHLGLLSQSLTQPVDPRRTWICQRDGAITAVAVAYRRPGGLVWDVEHLYAQEDREASALLEYVCGHAAEAGARRVFMETPAESRGADVCRRICFERYATATLCYLPARAPRAPGPSSPARPRRRGDGMALFQLFLAAVPQRVRSAEALTYEEWAGLRRGGRRHTSPWRVERVSLVWDADIGLRGCAELASGLRSQHLEMVVRPERESDTDGMLASVLGRASQKLPLYASARDYQPAFASALERAAFRAVGESDLYVRHLAARVPRPAFVPAQVTIA